METNLAENKNYGTIKISKKLPVIFLLFISITALTRYLAVDLKTMDSERTIIVVGAIELLTIAVFILRYSESKFGSETEMSNHLKTEE